MTLDDLRALANTKTGLVVMTVTRSFAPWKVNDVAGFPPETALDHLVNGVAYVGVKNPGEFQPAPKRPKALPMVTTRSLPARTETATGDKMEVDKPLPEGWAELHPLTIIQMAKAHGFDRSGVAEGEKVVDKAIEYLREVEKKTAEAKAAAPAV